MTRYVSLILKRDFLNIIESLILRRFNDENKKAQYGIFSAGDEIYQDELILHKEFHIGLFSKAKNAKLSFLQKRTIMIRLTIYVSQG